MCVQPEPSIFAGNEPDFAIIDERIYTEKYYRTMKKISKSHPKDNDYLYFSE